MFENNSLSCYHVVSLILLQSSAPAPPKFSGKFYLSQDAGNDKLFQEGVFTIFNEIDELKHEIKSMLQPNGTRTNPARSCYDLFLCNPSYEEGSPV